MRERVLSPEHDQARSLGFLAAAWMEHFTVHGPGDVQGERVELDSELFGFTVDAYALGARGRRLYDSAFLSRAKGRDKSGHAARFVLYELLGPCRFDGWAKGGERYQWRDFVYDYEPGEPMGRPVVFPFVRCLATEEGQAGNTYDAVYFNLTEGPLAEGLPRDAVGLSRVLLPRGGGEVVPSTAGASSKDGGKETFVVFDETHLYTLPQLRAMYDTVRRNMGAKRKDAEPWSLETSTMYEPGADSIAERTHAYARAIEEGKTRRARLLFDHREAPPDVDLEDEAAVMAALVETYGPFAEVMDLDRVLAEIYDPRNDPADSRRYYFNQATSAADSFFAEYEWAARARPERVVTDGEAVTLGFDGSKSRKRGVADATALIGCTVSDGHLFELGVWEQPTGPAGVGWEVPVALVDAAVEQAFARFNVVGFYADPAKWESWVATWEGRYGAGLKVKSSGRHPIEWWMTGNRALGVAQATDEFHTAVVEGELTHDGGFALTRHAVNARRRPGRYGIAVSKEHPDSPKKIDALVAGILARKARMDAVAAGVTGETASAKSRRVVRL